MAGYSISAKIETGTEVDFCIDPARLGLKQRTVKLEQKIAQLFEVLRDPVYRYLVASFGRTAEAEEITQETFLRLYRHLQNGQSVADARAWIFRVAHNLAIDQLKDSAHLKTIGEASWEEIYRVLPDPGLNPEQTILQQERLERLHTAMMQLSLQQQQCLHLRAEGFRYREIAEILEIDVSTVAEHLRRAIKRLMVQNNG